ncbi:hypothetical protein [Arthrobacter sp. Soil763]|uniref:hypothetical protein n=1 Tax=Arthrobacter sp. Soil763 TaxID=1736402 RepID=UPI0007021D6B|nr:hypothetical protein [Arthrobacter sp. Soil763]KRE79939.1 hypothetical protein ASG71_07855 [Arthrobacter sp. Soil763]
MADSELLKYSRIRDDYNLQRRVNAAMLVQALYWVENPPDMTLEQRLMRDWVIDHPLQPIDLMTAYVATMPEVAAASVLLEGGGVDTSEVKDSDIKYTVGVKWNTVAANQFKATA